MHMCSCLFSFTSLQLNKTVDIFWKALQIDKLWEEFRKFAYLEKSNNEKRLRRLNSLDIDSIYHRHQRSYTVYFCTNSRSFLYE